MPCNIGCNLCAPLCSHHYSSPALLLFFSFLCSHSLLYSIGMHFINVAELFYGTVPELLRSNTNIHTRRFSNGVCETEMPNKNRVEELMWLRVEVWCESHHSVFGHWKKDPNTEKLEQRCIKRKAAGVGLLSIPAPPFSFHSLTLT